MSGNRGHMSTMRLLPFAAAADEGPFDGPGRTTRPSVSSSHLLMQARTLSPSIHPIWRSFYGGECGMLSAMETPENERRAIEEYLRSQSGPDFVIQHVEKLTSEYVLGRQYDVWDAHTNEGRWWVITPFTNLYSQDHIRSMDIALSFHIGLMSRVMARDSVRFKEGGTKTWVLEVLRRLEVANDNLERAKEVEDVQAIGMRLRETLLTLIDKLHDLRLEMPEHIDL